MSIITKSLEDYVINPCLNYCCSTYVKHLAEESLKEASGMDVKIEKLDLSIRHIAVHNFEMRESHCSEESNPIVRARKLESDISIANLFFGEVLHLQNVLVDGLAIEIGADIMHSSLSSWMAADSQQTQEDVADAVPIRISGLKVTDPTISIGYGLIKSKLQPGDYHIEESFTTDTSELLSRLAQYSLEAASKLPASLVSGAMAWMFQPN